MSQRYKSPALESLHKVAEDLFAIDKLSDADMMRFDEICLASERVVRSSGNVYADLGFDSPDVEVAKCDLVIEMNSIIRDTDPDIEDVSKTLGISTGHLETLLRGRSGPYSVERLRNFVSILRRSPNIPA